MVSDQLLAVAIGVIVMVLLPVIAWLIKRQIDILESSTKERMVKIEGDVNALGKRLQESREEVLGQYVHKDDLREALESAFKPIREGIGRMERHIEDVFRRLDGKADRVGDRVGDRTGGHG